MSRAPWLLLFAWLLLVTPAWAQQGERARTLEELKAVRDEIDTQRARVVATRDARAARSPPVGSARTRARSSTFSSSRTLPGHSYICSKFSASSLT